jgi:HlyD family secretion protein
VRKSRRVLLSAAVVVVIAGVWGFVTLKGGSTTIDSAKLSKVEKGTLTISVVATGRIEPITKVEIKSKANGIIEKLLVDVDDVVEPGQVLVELDKEQLRAALREARANAQAAEAARNGAEAQLRKSETEATFPEVELAQRNFTRATELFKQTLVSQSDLDQARTALEQTQNRHAAAVRQVAIDQAKVSQAAANVAQANAAVERADEDLANATIRAPIHGTVLTRDVEVGSPVSSILNLGANATLVMTIGDIDRVFVRGKVDEADLGRVRVGQAARITTETFRDRIFDGQLTRISPIGVEQDNVTTFEVEASIKNPGKELKANMTANAEIILEQIPNALIVPETAVTYDANRHPFLDLADPGARTGRRRVSVSLGPGNGSRVQVLQGVSAGDTVVLPS